MTPDLTLTSGTSDSRSELPHECRPERTRCGTKRRGAAAVEFALVAPLLFMLVLGIIEFGRMMMVQQVLTNGAREGARKAVLPGITDAEAYQVIDSYLTKSGIGGHSRQISPSATNADAGTPIEVTVSVP